MRQDIFERAIVVMKAVTTERRRYKELEEETGISASNWQNAAKRKQKPTGQMIEALSRRWPQFAFWLSTGLTDPTFGHTAPGKAWTASQRTSTSESEDAARKYFDANALMQDLVYGSSDVDESGPPGDNEKVASAAKQKELDATIAQMAYQRRLQALRSEFGHDEKSQFDTRELKRVIAELEVARAKDALEESKDRLKMYAENPK